jgi:DNA-binding PadR family transcriptional regulator
MSDVLGGFELRVLLTILRLGRESYSVPIVEELEALGRSVSPSAVYVTLRRLERRGLLTSRMEPPAEGEGGRERRVFAVTSEAVDLLRATRDDLSRFWDGLEALES